MKNGRVLAITFLLALTFLLGAVESNGNSHIVAHAQSVADLRVEAVSIYVGQPRPGNEQDVTISFRVVNAGTTTVGGTLPNTAYPRQSVSVFPGTVTGGELDTLYLTLPVLGPGETAYMSRTITLPSGTNEFVARVHADVNHTLNDIHPESNVATRAFWNPFVLAPRPGQWFSIGPARNTETRIDPHNPSKTQSYSTAGRLTDVLVHPTKRDTIYVASPGADGWDGTGVWKTSNGGRAWQPITDSLPTVTVAAMALDASTDPERLYIATPDYGIFRSDDAGITWINVNPAVAGIRSNIGDGDLTVLLVDPTRPNLLYLTTRYGVERSQDHGKTWTRLLQLGTGKGLDTDGSFHYDGEATALVMDPRRPDVLYAALYNQGIYRTATGGLNLTTGAPDIGSWTRQNIGPADYQPVNGILLGITHPIEENDETVYALLASASIPAGHSLFRTTDGGRSWDQQPRWSCGLTDPKSREQFDRKYECNFSVILVDPHDRNRVYFGGPVLRVPVDVEHSEASEFGRIPAAADEYDWQPAAPHGDFHGLAFDPVNSRIIYAATDGGLYKSASYGHGWSFIGEGITSAEIYDIALAATDPDRVLIGTQDTGAGLFSRSAPDGGRVWEHCCGGDAAIVAINVKNENILYHGNFYQDQLWIKRGPWIAEACKPLQLCWEDFDKGLPPSEGGAGIDPATIVPAGTCADYYLTFDFELHPTDANTSYAACISVYRKRTTDPQNAEWVPIFTPPSGQAMRLAVDPKRNLLYVGSDQGEIFEISAQGSGGCQFAFRRPLCLILGYHQHLPSDIEVDSSRRIVYVSYAPTPNRWQDCSTYASRIYKLESTTPGGRLVAQDITGNLPTGTSGISKPSWLCVKALAIDPNLPRTLYAGTSKGVYRGRGNATTGVWVWEPYNNGMPPGYVRDLEVHPMTGHLFAATYGRGAFEVVPDRDIGVRISNQSAGGRRVIEPRNLTEILIAILSDRTFDAPRELDMSSLRFGRTGAEASLARCDAAARDVNGDGLPDVLCYFKTALTGLRAGDTEIILKGNTVEGVPIEGRDTIAILP